MEAKKVDENKFLSFFVGSFVIVFCMVTGIGLDKIGGFIDVPSILINGGLMIGSFIITYGTGGIGRYLRSLKFLLLSDISDKGELEYLMRFSNLGFILSIFPGIIASLIGSINMLSCGITNGPALTAGCAVMLITTFYGMITAMLFKVVYYKALEEKEKLG